MCKVTTCSNINSTECLSINKVKHSCYSAIQCNGVSNTTALHVINMPYFLDETTFHELSIGLNCQRSPHARISTPPKSRVKVSAIVHMLSEWSTSIQIKPNWSSPWNYMLFHEIIWISNVKYHEYSYMKLVWFRSFVETIMVSTRVRNSTNFKTNFPNIPPFCVMLIVACIQI